MGKNGAKKVQNSVSSSPAVMRVNYLHQAAALLTKQSADCSELSRVSVFYVETMEEVMRKAQVHIHPHMKRTICKKCKTVLDPAVGNLRLTLPRKGPKRMLVVCSNCGHRKSYRLRRDHKLCIEEQGSQVAESGGK